MAKRPAVSTLNASTIDILNVIRKNASAQYRDLVPEVTKAEDIPAVGDVLFGYPGMANEFIEALMGRIAYVAIKSATFYNPYADLKKGYLMTGEVVEDIFVSIAEVYPFYNNEPIEKRELGKAEPNVKSAFYSLNWKVQYKTSISDEQLRTAFTSMNGVQDLINRCIQQVYVAEKYDEFLLFKYLMIKAVVKGQIKPISAGSTTATAATAFRGYSSLMTFPSTNYNEAGVLNGAPRDNQVIFMDAIYNAQFDVEQLSASFHMDKTTFFGRQYLMDDWTTFDNDRWTEIRAQGTQVEEVTAEELEIMSHVKAILLDSDWFQFYDNLLTPSKTYVASTLTWNYFYTAYKTIAHSPFANAIVFVDDGQVITLPTEFTAEVIANDTASVGSVITLKVNDPTGTIASGFPQFVQTQDATEKGIAVHEYGVYIFPAGQTTTTPNITAGGKTFIATTALTTSAEVGTELTFNATGTA